MKNKNVVVKKACHSRGTLSGIYNACCCKIEENSLLNKYVEDPRLQTSGMTPNLITAHGFTLIELLVVVLIIGILAAVAVPQYNLTVNKAHYTQLKATMLRALRDQHLYKLENGEPTTFLSDLETFQDWKSTTNNTENFQSPDKMFSCGIHTYNGGFWCKKIGNAMWLEVRYSGGTYNGACFAYEKKNKKICQAIGAACPQDGTICSLDFH